MTVLFLIALAAEVSPGGARVEYRLVECPADSVKPDLARHELSKLWRGAREVAAFEVSARPGECFSVSRRSRRRYVAGYSFEDRRASPRVAEVGEGVLLWGRARRQGGKGARVILDTWVLLEEGAQLRRFKTRWGGIELPSVTFGGAGTSCAASSKRPAVVCSWQVPGTPEKVYALLAQAQISGDREKARAARLPSPEFLPPAFMDGDVKMSPGAPAEPRSGEKAAEPCFRAAAEPVKEKPLFVRLRLLRVKAALFDSLAKRPGAKELESWLRREEAKVVGQASFSSFSGQRACVFWVKRKAYLAGFERSRTSIRWVAAGAAAGVRAELEGDFARIEARAWASEFDEPFRRMKTLLGPVELPEFRFSSTGRCSAKLKPGEEGVLGASPLADGAMLILAAKVERVSK